MYLTQLYTYYKENLSQKLTDPFKKEIILQNESIFSIGEEIHLRCRGNNLFKIVFIGEELIVVEDTFGKEICVDKKNVMKEMES